MEEAWCEGHGKPHKHAVAPVMFSDVVGDGWPGGAAEQGRRLWVAEHRYPSATLMSPCVCPKHALLGTLSSSRTPTTSDTHQFLLFSCKRRLLLHLGSVAALMSFCFSHGCKLPQSRIWTTSELILNLQNVP